jgi:hypothetical protein
MGLWILPKYAHWLVIWDIKLLSAKSGRDFKA